MKRSPIDEAARTVRVPRAHVPVMLAEVLKALALKDHSLIVDGTFGAGGYSSAILAAAQCQVLAFDRDPTAIDAAASITQRYPNRLRVLGVPFGAMDQFVRIEETPNGEPLRAGPLVDGVVLDIGVSSMQIDQPERGFSFQTDGPLDMRMSQSGQYAGPSAADVVNTLDADPLADILFQLGDERRSRPIAKAIVMDRAKTPFTSTKQLADLVCRVLKTPKIDGRHAATRTFQALRIYVNDELGELKRGLAAAEALLKPGGRLVVVTFHSLEDRIVKDFLRTRSGRVPQGSRHGPAVASTAQEPTFDLQVARAIAPSDAETAANPRARSARLRWAVRNAAPPWQPESAGLRQ